MNHRHILDQRTMAHTAGAGALYEALVDGQLLFQNVDETIFLPASFRLFAILDRIAPGGRLVPPEDVRAYTARLGISINVEQAYEDIFGGDIDWINDSYACEDYRWEPEFGCSCPQHKGNTPAITDF